MHFQTSYTTGPSAVLWNAPTGQTDAHAGFSQCMHNLRMKWSFSVRTTVNLCSDCLASAAMESSYGRPLCSAHALSHNLQPIQSVASYRIALLIHAPYRE